jgi:hypothetical protein
MLENFKLEGRRVSDPWLARKRAPSSLHKSKECEFDMAFPCRATLRR